MKVRNGFVSNSSSSSFVLVVPMDIHCKAMREMDDELISKTINAVSKDSKFNGIDVAIVSFTTNGYYPEELDEFDWDNYDGGIDSIDEAFYEYCDFMEEKYKKDIIYVRMSV